MNYIDMLVQLFIALMLCGIVIYGLDESPMPEPAKGWAKAAFVLSVALVFLRKFGLI